MRHLIIACSIVLVSELTGQPVSAQPANIATEIFTELSAEKYLKSQPFTQPSFDSTFSPLDFDQLGFSIVLSVDPKLAYDGIYDRQRYPEVARLAELLLPQVYVAIQTGISKVSAYNPNFFEYARTKMQNRSIHMLFAAERGLIPASFHAPGLWPIIRPTIKISSSHARPFVIAIRDGRRPHPIERASFQNTVFHEFLHFLDLSMTKDHNEQFARRDDDAVYACAGLAFPVLGIFYVPYYSKPNASISMAEPAQSPIRRVSVANTRRSCRTCVLWHPDTKRPAESQVPDTGVCDDFSTVVRCAESVD